MRVAGAVRVVVAVVGAVRVVLAGTVRVVLAGTVRVVLAAAVLLRMAAGRLRGVGRFPVDRHAELDRPDPASVDAFAADGDAVETERVHGPRQHVERHAGVEQRAGDHVAGRSREAVEVQDSGHRATRRRFFSAITGRRRPPPAGYRRPCSLKL